MRKKNAGRVEIKNYKGVPYRDTDLKYESMIPVLEGKVPVFIHANSSKEILSAVERTESEGFKIVIVGGNDAWKITDVLKAKNIPIILTNIYRLAHILKISYKFNARFCDLNHIF